jgi:hypothetical protein
MNAEKAKRTHWTQREEAQLARLAKKHRAIEIAEILGRPYHGIKSKAERLGVSLLIEGENHHSARYADAIVEQARSLNEQGLGERRISRALGICSMTVRAWINFETRTGISIRS